LLYAILAASQGHEWNGTPPTPAEVDYWVDWAETVARKEGAVNFTGGELLELARKERRSTLTAPSFDLQGLDAWSGTLDADPVLWGTSEKRLALASGRPTAIFGSDGAGKTLLAGNLAAGALGHRGHETLLGYPVAPLPEDRSVLYLAFDGPHETRTSFARFGLGAGTPRLNVFAAAPPWDPEQATADTLDRFVSAIEERTGETSGLVIVDNAQRAYGAVARDDRSAVLGNALNRLEARGVSVVLLAQSRKNGKPTSKDDAMLGSLALSGTGSIVSLYRLEQGDAEAGKPTRTELRHHKGIGSDSTKAHEVLLDLTTGAARLTDDGGPSPDLIARVHKLPEVGLFGVSDGAQLWDLSTPRARSVLAKAEAYGLVEFEQEGKRGAKLYRRAS
jgi:hypothetical protein